MFDRIAGVYDPLNTAMTAGLHHRWRARAADQARVGPGSRVLDVATGTGDLAIELARRVAPGGEVIGERLLRGDARARAARRPRRARRAPCGRASSGPTRWRCPTTDDRFDAATVGFGVRNFDDLARGLAEMARVVRPGGRVVVLEITTPTRPPLSLFYRLWFDRIVPALGLAHGARSRGCAAIRGSARRASPTPTATCRTRSSAFPRPRCSRPRWSARACRRSPTCSRPAGSSRSTRARSRAEAG